MNLRNATVCPPGLVYRQAIVRALRLARIIIVFGLVLSTVTSAKSAEVILRELARRSVRAHDPSTIVACKDEFWLFSTGNGILSKRSKDLARWDSGPAVFSQPPSWTTNIVTGFHGHYWAPDVIRIQQRYFLYYSVSTWGKRTSAIGLAINSTYEIRVGRSLDITGPYRDRQGVDLLAGGGTLLLRTTGPLIGPGHAGILTLGETNWLSFHFYDGQQRGIPTLGLLPLSWDTEGWPVLKP